MMQLDFFKPMQFKCYLKLMKESLIYKHKPYTTYILCHFIQNGYATIYTYKDAVNIVLQITMSNRYRICFGVDSYISLNVHDFQMIKFEPINDCFYATTDYIFDEYDTKILNTITEYVRVVFNRVNIIDFIETDDDTYNCFIRQLNQLCSRKNKMNICKFVRNKKSINHYKRRIKTIYMKYWLEWYFNPNNDMGYMTRMLRNYVRHS